MVKPSDFILSTDYATLKNDADASISVVVPGSQSIPGTTGANYSYLEFYADSSIGVQGSIIQSQIASSKDSTKYCIALNKLYTRNGSLGTYSVVCVIIRTSPTNLRCLVYIPNPYATTLTTEAGDETIYFDVTTFIPPIV